MSRANKPLSDVTVHGNANGAELDVKRLALPGITLESICPKCKRTEVIPLGDINYLAYPIVNKPIDFTFYHQDYYDDCNAEWSVKIILNISISADNA